MVNLKYKVIIDENFHFMDKNESYSSGEFSTYQEAVAKCKKIVDEFLLSAISEGDSSNSLFTSWLMYGENPFIIGGTENSFSSSKYAELKSKELTE